MGGKDSKPKLINQAINLKHERILIDQIDKIYENGFDLAEQAELIRCQFIPKWNLYVYLTGAIVLLNPRFEQCMDGMLWKFATDSKDSTLSNVEILEIDPYLNIIDKSQFLPEDFEIGNSFSDLCRFYTNNCDDVYNLETELQKVDGDIKSMIKNPSELLASYNIAPIDTFSLSKRLKANAVKLRNAYETIYIIKFHFNEMHKGLHRYHQYLKVPQELRRWEDIGRMAKKERILKPSRIVYRYSIDEKLTTYDDHFDILDDDTKAVNEAKTLLEFYRSRFKLKTLKTSPVASTLEPMSSKETKDLKEKDKETSKEGVYLQQTTYGTQLYKEEDQPIRDKDYIEELNKPSITYKKAQSTPMNYEEDIQIIGQDFNKDKQSIHSLKDSSQDLRKQSELEKLRSELEKTKKLNDELNSKIALTESKNFTQGHKLKNTIYLRHNLPLKNWHLALRKSVTASNHQHIKSMECVQDLDFIITGHKNGQIIFWKFPNFHDISEHKIISIFDEPVKALLYLNDGKSLLCGGVDGKLIRCDLTDFSCKLFEGNEGGIRALADPANGYSVYSTCINKIVEWDLNNCGILKRKENAHDSFITDLQYSRSREILISGSKDKSIKIWDKHFECMGILNGHADTINSLCFAYTADDLYVVSVSKDSYITFWNLSDKNLTKSLKTNSEAKKVFYLQDKKSICSVHKNGVFTLWNIEKEENKEFFTNKNPYSNGIYFNDSHNLIFGGTDGTLEFWNSK